MIAIELVDRKTGRAHTPRDAWVPLGLLLWTLGGPRRAVRISLDGRDPRRAYATIHEAVRRRGFHPVIIAQAGGAFLCWVEAR